ncbi:polar amino acid transport system substrate-binding protein [Paraburkholderia sp. UCT70]|uniref:ABC transporter substrate-binding protein n=1 Tax=Paraburkholderia sp. UCT70 TaxID=2991068 RepID=UPI003D24B7FE
MNVRSVLLCLLSLCWLAVASPAFAQTGSAACEPTKLAQKYPSLVDKVIKIGADPQTPPYVVRDNADLNVVRGISADMAAAAMKCAGIKYEWFLGAWSGMLPALNGGQIDLFWDDLYYTPERAKAVNYVVYMRAASGALISAKSAGAFKDFDSLCGHPVAVGVGMVEVALVDKQSQKCVDEKKPGITKIFFPDLASGTRLIQNNRADAMMYDLGLVGSLVKESPQTYARGFSILSGQTLGVAVSKHNPDLQKAVAEALRILQANGEQKAIFARYGVDPMMQIPVEIREE